MSSIFPARWLVTLSALTALNAWAQPAQSPALQPWPTSFRSAFEGYRPFTEEKALSWKDANDTVGQIGGWRAYAREVQESNAADGTRAAPVAPVAPGAANPHAGHGKP